MAACGLLRVTKRLPASCAFNYASAASCVPPRTQHGCVPSVSERSYGHRHVGSFWDNIQLQITHRTQMKQLQQNTRQHEPSARSCLLAQIPGCGHRLLTLRRGMAGHSKWANIRHIKAAKDAAKAKVANEIAMKARTVIKETGNPDPKSNLKLARIVEEAKSKDVPNATIEKILSQANKMKNAAPVLFEAKGPGGSVMLIEAMAAKLQQTKTELQSVVKKCGFSMFEGGSLAKMCFEEKGVVLVGMDTAEGKEVDMDMFVDIAIEAGAEEVTIEGEGEEQVLQFLCEADDVFTVKKELEARDLPVRSAEVTFFTTNSVPFTPEAIEMLGKVLEKLDDHPDVVKVYTNVRESST